MHEHEQQGKLEKAPELKRPEDTIKDLEPEKDESDAVKGGSSTLNWQKV